jgi:hypothetical protein
MVGTISQKMRSELLKINDIRNMFAHELVDSFDNEDVSLMCSGLGLCQYYGPPSSYPFGTAREKYVSTVKFLIFVLFIAESNVQKLAEDRAPLDGESYTWETKTK